jgi:hypothetical protein
MRATKSGQPVHLLLDIVECLDVLGIPYAVIGAFAVSYYGGPRGTNDSDASIWLHGTGINETDLAKRIADTGYQVEIQSGDIDDPIRGVIAIQDRLGNQVDLILGIRGMDPAAVRRAMDASLFDAQIRIVGVEDLIAMRAFAGRVQDLEDVHGILQVAQGNLNIALISAVAARYGDATQRTIDAILAEFPR